MPWPIFFLFLIIFYFMLIRPQNTQNKKNKQMRDSLERGDRVCTVEGVIGRIISMKDNTVTIETSANHTRMKVLREGIRCRVTEDDEQIDHIKGKTIKNNKESKSEEESKPKRSLFGKKSKDDSGNDDSNE